MTLTVSTQLSPSDNLASFARMLDSVSFADEILVFQLGTAAVPSRPRLRFIEAKEPRVIEYLRARQVKEAKGDWVLVLDFDEVVTPALAKEIKSVITNSTPYSVYAFPRRNYSLGYPLKFGGWGTDYVQRLFLRRDFIDWPQEIHSPPRFRGQLGLLKGELEHHKDESLEYIVNKTNRYTDQEAKQFYEGGLSPVTSLTLIRKLKMEMLRRGVLKLGLLDGKIGLIQSIYQGFSVFLSFAKLYEKQLEKK